ncbi:inorganic phosphate transporter [Oscillatoria salina]|uniref:inorganic phosphate transporter n=1 Tax=Oscillatoria salina TaxID=331517 RepID=UPI0013BD9927|nr:inorganic phosphate transporter [Oscillatoria salina]MBZ8180680.1 inorganic phosphate transporter [Oscillatoria salina IIICB1]NET87380.1 inorganic phosphate transporter [Kamptonema sp. SIO1D9]
MSSSFLQLGLTALLAFYVAWNLGANDVANSMGTSVGSKALTLRQAIIVAGVLEFSGAVIFGQNVSATLATEIVEPELFANTPKLLLLGMIAVLLAAGLWLQIATSFGLPVASSHAVVGAIAGFSWVAAGFNSVDWSNIGSITSAWLITPLISGAIAALFYSQIQRWILNQPDPLAQLQEWIPWLSAILLSVFGVIVLPTIFATPFFNSFALPNHDFSIAVGAIATVSLTIASWRGLEAIKSRGNDSEAKKEQLQAVEKQLGRFQVISACFVAFAHGSNDVGNAIAPLAAIAYILRTGTVPIVNFVVPLWILILGGAGIVAGLAAFGKNVITTVGEEIITLQPSSGFCAEIATATTVLVASRLGLPVSTSQALVGGVVGIGLFEQSQKIKFQTVRAVVLAWVITLPATAILSAIGFTVLRSLFY